MRSSAARLAVGLSLLILAVTSGGCHKKSPNQPSCTFSVSASTFSIPATGGSGVVNVATADGCAWTAAANANWLSVTSGATGSGPGTVSFAASTNVASAARVGTLTVAGETIAITQEGASAACTYVVSPESVTFTRDGGVGTATVTTPAACPWTAASTVGWIRITEGAAGSGNGAISYAVERSDNSDSREGTITVAGRTVVVTQAGTSPTCVSEVSPTSESFASDGGSASVAVRASGSCGWEASSGASWLTITEGASGAGAGTVRYTVAANPNSSGRQTSIDIGGLSVIVAQSGNLSACEYSVAPVTFTPCMSFPSQLTATVTTGDMCPWTAISNAPWMTLTQGTSGLGSGHIQFNVSDNYDAPRSGQILVSWPTPTAGQNVQVAQAGCRYAVTKSAIGFAAAGGSDNFDVLQESDPLECGGPLQNGCLWTATSNVSWITITSSLPVQGDGRVSFTVASNPQGDARAGTITVRDKTVQITQAGTLSASHH
jgi:hypothetical protein